MEYEKRFSGQQYPMHYGNKKFVPKPGYVRPSYSATKVYRAVHTQKGYWDLERLEDGEYDLFDELEFTGTKYVYKGLSSSTLSGLLNEIERMLEDE